MSLQHLDFELDYLYKIGFRPLNLKKIKNYISKYKLTPKVPIITVTGTNGKGSTVETINNLLISNGFSVGKFTSPHLIAINERIQVNNQVIDDNSLSNLLRIKRTQLELDAQNYFSVLFLVALSYWQSFKLDYVILEVGIGGKYDVLNLLDADVLVISSIGLDHEARLGGSRSIIGWQKAGLMRAKQSVVLAEPNAPKSITDCAISVGANVYKIQHDFWSQYANSFWNWHSRQQSFYGLPYPNLFIENVSSAIAVCERLNVPLQASKVRSVLKTLSLHGRQEVVHNDPEILLDVSHNAHALQHLLQSIPQKPTILIFSALTRKSVEPMIQVLRQYVEQWIICESKNPHSYSADSLTQIIKQQLSSATQNPPPIYTKSVPSQAVKFGLSLCPKQYRLLICGCFALVAEVKLLIPRLILN